MRALAFLALLMAALPAAPAWAASGNSATATGMASATIVKPIAVATTAATKPRHAQLRDTFWNIKIAV